MSKGQETFVEEIHGDDNSSEVAEEENQWHNIYMFLQRRDIPLVTLAVALSVLTSLSVTGSSILIGKVFGVLSNFAKGEYLSFDEFNSALRTNCLAILGLGGGTLFLTWFNISCWMRLGEMQQSRARTALYNSILTRNMEWFEANSQLNGDITQVNRCIEELRTAASECTGLVIQSLSSIISLTVTSFTYNWSLTLVILSCSPILVLIEWFLNKKLQKSVHLENDYTADAAKVLDFNLTSPTLVKCFNAQDTELKKFQTFVQLSRNAFNWLTFYSSLNESSLRTLILTMFVSAFWYGHFLVQRGSLTSESVVTTFSSCMLLADTVRSLTEQFVHLQKGNVSLKRILKFLDETNTERVPSIDNRIYPKECRGDITFDNVNFTYPSRTSEPLLRNVSLNIPAGQMTFLVGKSGSGKSTLSSLLLNFYSPDTGTVSIDGFKVDEVNSLWLTDNISLVQQRGSIFNDTIKTNICLGLASKQDVETVSDPQIQDALQFSLLKQFVLDLPAELETLIGCGNRVLSGGQQQKIELARAKMRDTPILILDESLSALDIVQKELLIAAIKRWRRHKTTIMMTHDYSQIDLEDHVVLMENGRIKLKGLKQEILKEDTHESAGISELTKFWGERTEKVSFESSIYSEIDSSSWYYSKEFEKEKRKRLSFHPQRSNQYRRSVGKRQRQIQAEPEQNDQSTISEEHAEHLLGVWEIFWQLRKQIKKKTLITFGLIFAIINGAAHPVFSYCFSKLLVGIVESAHSNKYILLWALTVTGIAFLDGVTTFLKTFLLSYVAESWVLEIRDTLFKSLSEQSLSWRQNSLPPNEITALLMNDIRDLRLLVSSFLDIIFTVIVLMLMSVVWSLVVGWKLSSVSLSFIPLFMIITALYSQLLLNHEDRYKTAVADLENHQHDMISEITTIKCLRLNTFLNKKYRRLLLSLCRAGNKRAVSTGLGVGISAFLMYAAQSAIMYYGLVLVCTKEYSTSQFLEVLSLMLFGISSTSSILMQIPEMSRSKRLATYIQRLSDSCVKSFEYEGQFHPYLNISRNKVEFNSLSFRYSPGTRTVLRDISFSIAEGEVFGIVGESGSGKSTLVSLLIQLYPADRLNIWGTEVKDIDSQYLRSNIAIVPQKLAFIDGTVRDNLMYGLNAPKSDQEIIEVLKMAQIFDFVVSLPQSLDTVFTYGNCATISGGQAQRLSICRALLRDPDILILDECTSALDPVSASGIRDLINNTLRHRNMTIIIITHHEEMMQVTDRMVVLKDGEVLEQGSYSGLIENKYSELYRIVRAGRL